MTHTRPLPDLAALAAQLRLAALALVAELAEWMGAGRLAAALRRRMTRELGRFERFATGIVVLTALRAMPPPPPGSLAHRRPLAAPRGFARVACDANAMRAMQRRLFPRTRDLQRRLARFDAILDDVAAAGARLVSLIARIPPASRLAAVKPPAQALAPRVGAVSVVACDTS